jgi:plasmid stabilization system protein ParE
VKIEWSETALGRVEEIVHFIAADDPEAATRWATELFTAVERLADFPGSGQLLREDETLAR